MSKEKPLKADNQEGLSLKRSSRYITMDQKLNMPVNKFLAHCVKIALREAIRLSGAPSIKTETAYNKHLKFIERHKEVFEQLLNGTIEIKQKVRKYPQS